MEKEKKKKSNAKIVILSIIILLIVALIMLGVVYKIRVIGNPVTLTTIALEDLGDSLDEKDYGKLASFIEDNDTFSLDMTGNVTMPMDMGTLEIDAKMQEDIEKREATMDFDLKLNGEDAIYLEGQLDKDALYYAFNKQASKYYYLTDIKYPEVDELDYDSILDKFIRSFNEVVKKDDFVLSEKEITVNGDKFTAKQYSLKLNSDLQAKLLENFYEKIENDKELLRELTVFANITEEELINVFNSSIDDIKTYETEDLYYNLYVYKNTAVRFELSDSDMTVMIDDYKNTEITVKTTDVSNEEMILTVTEGKNEWTIKANSTDFRVDGTISEEKYDITIKAESAVLKANGTTEYKTLNDSLDINTKGTVSIEQEGTTISIPYNFDIKLKEIEKVTKKNTTNKVDINNMTPEEETEFNREVSQIPLFGLLYGSNDETEVAPNTAEDYSYGYGYGY